MSAPTRCQSIQDEIDRLQRDRDLVQELIREAPPNQRPALMERLRALDAQIRAAQDRLADCLGASQPPQTPIEGQFAGTATLTTTFPQARGPFARPVQFRIMINAARTTITLTTFPPIQVTFNTPLGRNTTTITRSSGGSGSYAAGRIRMPLGLRFDQSHILARGSDLNVMLSTDPPGSPLSPQPFGNLTLVGSGTFQGGTLGGQTGTLNIRGTLSAVVPPPTTTVPNVRELRRDLAVAQVVAARLVPRSTGVDQPDAWVFTQSPSPGTVVNEGSTVTLQLRTGPIP